jgi:Kef-type K+ transport system membrane component KefB
VSNFDLVLKLFLQLAVILAVCRAVGWLGRFAGQTQVVSEMIAGVLLGPSLFRIIAPEAQQWLFPKASMPVLYAISQIGLVLYMFMVGLEFDTGLIRGRLRSAGLISFSGILVPFTLGVLLAYGTGRDAGLFTAKISPSMAALYMGAAMSITAFPMLARIIQERGIAKTRIGTVSLAAGSLDDAAAWCLLAFILAMVKADLSIAIAAILGGTVYVLAMVYLFKPLLARAFADRELNVTTTTMMLMVIMLSAWCTDAIGIYAVFGAFICGTCMPRGKFADAVQDKFGLITEAMLVPVFFVYSGLNTQIGLVNSTSLWALAAVVIGIAIVGKGLACALAARASGEPWRESWTIGTLMNARGLMELIILNIGLEKGLITSTLFTIMVLMAIVTTVMASPLFQWIYGAQKEGARAVPHDGATVPAALRK